jgi:hypothetical protein
LRTEVLEGCARPEGLGVIVYHGMLQGLTLLLTHAPVPQAVPPVRDGYVRSIPHDPQFVHLFANLVLRIQSEVIHVY